VFVVVPLCSIVFTRVCCSDLICGSGRSNSLRLFYRDEVWNGGARRWGSIGVIGGDAACGRGESPTKRRKRPASGQQKAKPSRLRLVVSCIRTAILSRRSRRAAHSARAKSRTAGKASRIDSISRYAAVCSTGQTWLSTARRHEVRSEASWALWGDVTVTFGQGLLA
jgi:hypothetical protein